MRLISIIAALICLLGISGCGNSAAGNTDTAAPKNIVAKNYVANKNSGKLHSIECDSLPYEDNRIYFATIADAEEAGYIDYHKECMGEDSSEGVSYVQQNYIANKNSGVIHSPSCDSLPYEKNSVYFASLADAAAAGYYKTHKECMGG